MPPNKIECAANALHPIKIVMWGELAIGFHGAGIIVCSHMLIPSESDFDLAEQKLIEAGFRPAPWAFGTSEREKADPFASEHSIIDQNSKRFQYPPGVEGSETLFLLKGAYVGLIPPKDPASAQRFHCDGNLYIPDKALLLESTVRTRLQQPDYDYWSIVLEVWAISYIYGLLMVDDDILDSCEDESIKSWFNEKIRRGKGGLDRNLYSKRVGRREPVPEQAE